VRKFLAPINQHLNNASFFYCDKCGEELMKTEDDLTCSCGTCICSACLSPEEKELGECWRCVEDSKEKE
jgi:hypothetical protein